MNGHPFRWRRAGSRVPPARRAPAVPALFGRGGGGQAEGMENSLRLMIALCGSALAAYAVVRAADLAARRADARRPGTPLWGLLRRPLRLHVRL